MQNISIAIITKNEEKNISRCLKSLTWADEIVVVDSGSTDRTVEICREFACKIIQIEWQGFGKTKYLAVENCHNNWVLVVDADEVITENLQKEIRKILVDPKCSAYKIKRNSFFMDKMIKHCGWNKDYTLRLFDKRKGQFNHKIVHESVEISNGLIGVIKEPMLHYTFPKIKDHISKMVNYSELGAEQKFKKANKSNLILALLRGIFKFLKMYILQFGFLDGKAGFILSVNSAFGVYLKYIYIWEKSQC